MSCKFHKAVFHAVLAATLYAVSIPFSKLMLAQVPPTMLAAFLYIGAGMGMGMGANMGRMFAQMSETEMTNTNAGSRFCSQCGASVGAKVKFCPDCGAKMASQGNTCSKCGATVKAGSKFCPECGHKL